MKEFHYFFSFPSNLLTFKLCLCGIVLIIKSLRMLFWLFEIFCAALGSGSFFYLTDPNSTRLINTFLIGSAKKKTTSKADSVMGDSHISWLANKSQSREPIKGSGCLHLHHRLCLVLFFRQYKVVSIFS